MCILNKRCIVYSVLDVCCFSVVDVVFCIFQSFVFDYCFWLMDESNNKYVSKLMNMYREIVGIIVRLKEAYFIEK